MIEDVLGTLLHLFAMWCLYHPVEYRRVGCLVHGIEYFHDYDSIRGSYDSSTCQCRSFLPHAIKCHFEPGSLGKCPVVDLHAYLKECDVESLIGGASFWSKLCLYF